MPSFIPVWALIINAILSVILGFIWYGPLFGKAWMKLAHISMPDKKPGLSDMSVPIILSLIGALLMNFVLASTIAFHNFFYEIGGYYTAMSLAVLVWLGFIVPLYLNFVGWEGKPWKLFFIHAFYWLVYLLISASIITAFVK